MKVSSKPKWLFAAAPKSADSLISRFSNQQILSINVRSGWLAMPPVADFLEMFAGMPYNREKKQKSKLHFLLPSDQGLHSQGQVTTPLQW